FAGARVFGPHGYPHKVPSASHCDGLAATGCSTPWTRWQGAQTYISWRGKRPNAGSVVSNLIGAWQASHRRSRFSEEVGIISTEKLVAVAAVVAKYDHLINKRFKAAALCDPGPAGLNASPGDFAGRSDAARSNTRTCQPGNCPLGGRF